MTDAGRAGVGERRDGWFGPMVGRLRELRRHGDPGMRGIFDLDAPVSVARAPGRLDVMGGIADYSGSLVLELPLARATYAAIQPQPAPRCDLVSLRDGGASTFGVPLEALETGRLSTPESLRAKVAGSGTDGWAAYVLGLVHWCLHRRDPPAGLAGFRLLIASEVPEGKGVASSAALEVAAMTAIAHHLGITIPAEELAAACQWVENRVVGAPCGIMDQMTAAAGRGDHLLRLRCQPADVEGHVPVPDEFGFFGIDSGIRHAVSGADYVTVRCAAFMGLALLAEAAPREAEAWGGYLANIDPATCERLAGALPETMAGADFLGRGLATVDPVTRVEPDRTYPVRAATAHPILENDRVERFAGLVDRLDADGDDAATEMGRLMYASHASYGACGLGSDGTDRLVAVVREAGPDHGLFGAKITGGGSGGTVAVLGRGDALDVVREIAAEYTRETGRVAEVFAGSSPGAAATGVVRLSPRG